jgi:hypothetical protein
MSRTKQAIADLNGALMTHGRELRLRHVVEYYTAAIGRPGEKDEMETTSRVSFTHAIEEMAQAWPIYRNSKGFR